MGTDKVEYRLDRNRPYLSYPESDRVRVETS